MSEAAFEETAATSGPRVVRFLCSRGLTPEDAADVLQETLLVAWRRIDDLPVTGTDRTAWLIGIARRTAANHHRARRSRDAATIRLIEQIRLEQTRSGSTEQETRVRSALDALRAPDREILQLSYWEDLNTEQLAIALGIRAGAARKRLQRAREALRAQLAGPDSSASVRFVTQRA